MRDARTVVIAVAGSILSGAGCSSMDVAPPADAGADHFVSASPRESGPLPDLPTKSCHTEPCAVADDSPLRPDACCNEAGACGARVGSVAGDQCLSPNGVGNVDLGCPPLTLAGGPTLQGCCRSEGTCGIYDRFTDLGCMPTVGSTGEPNACTHDPRGTCRQVVEIVCDGSEDCSKGQTCCARRQPDSYDRIGCFETCDSIQNDGAAWFEVCNGETGCSDARYQCLRPSTLPSFLGRCYVGDDAAFTLAASAGVRCGDSTVCDVGKKCCWRPPSEPYCSPVDSPCACSGLADAARTDGGMALDASLDAPP